MLKIFKFTFQESGNAIYRTWGHWGRPGKTINGSPCRQRNSLLSHVKQCYRIYTIHYVPKLVSFFCKKVYYKRFYAQSFLIKVLLVDAWKSTGWVFLLPLHLIALRSEMPTLERHFFWKNVWKLSCKNGLSASKTGTTFLNG